MNARVVLGLGIVSSWIHTVPMPWSALGLGAALAIWAGLVIAAERRRSDGWGRW